MLTDNNKLLISDEIRAELSALESILESELSHGSRFISREAVRLLKSGGKRLRPLLTILFAKIGDKYISKSALYTGAALEVMHMATLVHDDTIDNADQRRGVDTTFKKHGIHTAVYTGDWMLLKSLKLLSGAGLASELTADLLGKFADGLEFVCNGEIDQYYGRGSIPTLSKYLERVRGKTAALFGVSCAAGARIAGYDNDLVKTAGEFGEYFGMAFQIRDDIIDLSSTGDKAGKPVENDLREGIVTLPILLACGRSSDLKHKVEAFLSDPDHASVSLIIKEAIKHGGLLMADKKLNSYVAKCRKSLSAFPDCDARSQLSALVDTVFPKSK